MIKKIVIGLSLVAILCILGYNYLYQDHRDVALSQATASFNSQELINLFTDDDVVNDTKALDQVIEIQGVVSSVEETSITLDDQIFVEILETTGIKQNESITIKGRCLGYDDLMEEVKIDQAILK
ncbi:MAG: OB-fold protein [Nonlabens sp.]|uniref:OB-fold protein n=1 Tax=Nonlabens sp. TaxID=1888209 RepID=UPI003EF59976